MQGVFKAYKKSGEEYFRASITYKNKHISLGSYDNEADANAAYHEANNVLYGDNTLDDYSESNILDFKKWVSLINYRDNGMYIKTPIYLCNKYFRYYFAKDKYFIFDVDDLFYYSNHSIMMRDGHMFVSDYGMQVSILSRYGIKNYSVPGRDYIFVNGDKYDYRYKNISVISRYHGVVRIIKKGNYYYKARIHINGDYVIGTYQTENEAAIAYNKARDILTKAGINKNFPENYIEGISAIEYAAIYSKVSVSKKIREYVV